MASTFSTNLNLELMAKGEQANAWGTITNDNLSAVDAEFALRSTDNPTQSAIGQHQPFVGQQVWASAERTLYICSTASNNATASSHYRLIHKMQGINATAASSDVIVVTGGDAQAGHVSVSGGMNVTGVLSAQSFAVNSATFSAIHVKDTASVSILNAKEVHAASASIDSLRVPGVVSASGLHVSATACLDGPVFISGDAIFDGGVNVNNLTASGNVIVSGCVQAGTLAGNFTFSGDLSASTLQVATSASVGGDLRVGGTASLDGPLVVSGAANFKGNATVGGVFIAKSSASVASDLHVGGTITAGNLVSKDGLAVSGSATILGALDVGGSVSVGGNSRFTGAVSADNTFFASGKATFDAGVLASGDITALSNVIVSGCVNAGTVAGAFTFSGDLSASSLKVFSSANFGGNVHLGSATGTVGGPAKGIVSVDNELFVSGTAQFKGVTTAVGNFFAKANASVGGNLNVEGTTSLDTLVVSATSHFKAPVTVSSNLHVLGTASFGNDMIVDGTLSVQGNINSNAGLDVSGQAIFGKDIAVSATAHLGGIATVSGKLHAKADVSIGQDLHVLGTATVGKLVVKSTAELSAGLQVAGTVCVSGTVIGSGGKTMGGDIATGAVSKAWCVMASAGTVQKGFGLVTASCRRAAAGNYRFAFPDFSSDAYFISINIEENVIGGSSVPYPIINSKAVGSCRVDIFTMSANATSNAVVQRFGAFDPERIYFQALGTVA